VVGVREYARDVRASREVVWHTLTNCQQWRGVAALVGWFGHVEWYEGEPWKVGSRILIEHYWPTRSDVQLVLLSYTALQEFSWIGHGRGLTAHQQIRMEAMGKESCRISSRMEYVLGEGEIAGTEADPVADRLLRTFLDAIADHAEQQSGNVGQVRAARA